MENKLGFASTARNLTYCKPVRSLCIDGVFGSILFLYNLLEHLVKLPVVGSFQCYRLTATTYRNGHIR